MASEPESTKRSTTRFILWLITAMVLVIGISAEGEPRWASAESIVTQIGLDIDGEAAGDYSGYSVSLSSDGTRVAVGANGNDGIGGNAGHVRIYEWNGTAWTQLGLDIDGEAAGDQSGFSLSLSSDGSHIAIGAPNNRSQSGHVRIYRWSGTAWTQLGSDIDGEAAGDFSGNSVSLSSDGTRVAIGAPNNDGNGGNAGHVRIYRWSGTAWIQVGSDIDGEAAGDQSGFSVSLSSDGTRVAIGAPINRIYAGQVRIYDWNGSAWTQTGSDIDGEAGGDKSGYSVSLSSDGTQVAVGAYQNGGNGGNAGHVRIFGWNGSAWIQTGSDIDGEAAGDQSGFSVSLSSDGTRVAIGAKNANSNAGQVRIYDWNGSAWTQTGTDIEGEVGGDYSGYSVSLSSDETHVAIGAPYNDGNGGDAGHVRVFSIASSTSSTSTPTNSSTQENTSSPGIFLTVYRQSGSSSAKVQARFGAYSIQEASPYVVTIRDGSSIATQRVLYSGTVSSGGHLDQTITLPALSSGTHTVVFSAYNTSGAQLILGNTITVDSTGTITSVTAESLQPSIH